MRTPLPPLPLSQLALATLAALAATAAPAAGGHPPDATPPMTGKTAPLPGPSGKPRLAFLELAAGPEVTKEVAQAAGEVLVVALSDTGKFDVITKADVKAILGYEAQAQLLGCSEASCMVDLGGALGAAFLVSGSLGRLGGQLQLTLALIDTNRTTVGKRVSLGLDGSALQAGMKDAVQRLTGEVVAESGPADACGSPPCAREAVAACKRWWEKEWDAQTIVGIIPDGPIDQLLVDGRPARVFRMVVRTRDRNGARGESLAYVRFKKVEGDWYFDQGSMRHLRNLPLASQPDEAPKDGELQKLLSEGFSAAKKGAKITRLEAARFPDYTRADAKAQPPVAASWSYQYSVTFESAGKTTICPRAEGKLVHAGRAWKYEHGRDVNCEEVLDPQ